MGRFSFSAIALALTVVANLPAQQPGDPADRARVLQQVAIQKFESEVNAAIDEARRLARTDPAGAAERLNVVLRKLDTDALLPPDKRRALTGQLQDALAILNRQPAAPAGNPGGFAGDRLGEAQRRDAGPGQGEIDEIRNSLAEIESFHADKRFVEAERLADHLARKYPQNRAAQVMSQQLDMAGRVRAARELLAEYEQRLRLAMQDVDRSALPPKGDIEFPDPEKWKEMTARRNPVTLTEKEQAIMEALEKPVTLNYRGAAFSEVVQEISDALGQPILIDKVALEGLEIDSSSPVTLRLNNVSARTALRKILGDKGLTYLVQNESIQVTSVERARSTLVTRVYYVGDLIAGINPVGGVPFNPYFDQAVTAENARIIVDMIKSSVDPTSWEGQGGFGSVRFHGPTLSVIVTQTAEVHSLLAGKFAR